MNDVINNEVVENVVEEVKATNGSKVVLLLAVAGAAYLAGSAVYGGIKLGKKVKTKIEDRKQLLLEAMEDEDYIDETGVEETN